MRYEHGRDLEAGWRRGTGERRGRGLLKVAVVACLISACSIIGASPASAGCRCQSSCTRRYVTTRPVIVKERCVQCQPAACDKLRPHRPIKIVEHYDCYAAPRVVVRRRPVVVREERVVYVEPCYDREVVEYVVVR